MTLARFRANNHPGQISARGALDEIDDRGTEQAFVNALAERLGGPFTLDVAAAPHNTKCPTYYTRAQNGLTQEWPGRIWCNPPYSHPHIGHFIRKAWTEWAAGRPEVIAMLIPANRTEQGAWQQLVEPYRDQPGSPLRSEFLPGRMRFVKPGQTHIGANERPPFGVCLLLWQRSGPPDLPDDLLAELGG